MIDLVDRTVRQRKERLEKERFLLLQKALREIEEAHRLYSFKRAYVFGSATVPGHFQSDSDLDIAIEGLDDSSQHIPLAARLQDRLPCAIDVVLMEESHFADCIRHRGIAWTPPH